MESFGNSQRREGVQLKKLVFLIAAAFSLTPTFASPQPIADNSAGANSATLEARSSWAFSCFPSSPACFLGRIGEDGTTKHKGSSVVGCTEINKKGCAKYSFASGGDYKLCLYASDDCTGDGDELEGDRSCGNVGSTAGSYQVVSYDAACI